MKHNHRDLVTMRGVDCLSRHRNVLAGTGEAPRERCLACHNQSEKLARYGDIPFVHANRVTKRNMAGFHCHREMRHGAGEGVAGIMPRLSGGYCATAGRGSRFRPKRYGPSERRCRTGRIPI